jgi:hypothetical protein
MAHGTFVAVDADKSDHNTLIECVAPYRACSSMVQGTNRGAASAEAEANPMAAKITSVFFFMCVVFPFS